MLNYSLRGFAITCAIATSTLSVLGDAAAQEAASAKDKVPTIRPTDNLTVVGIPEIPATLADQVRKYTEARSASFLSWHPTQGTMLVSTRFGNSNQVHRVAKPGAARYQLTFFNEPIGNASYDPLNGNYFLFTKDVGGNEFGQIYRHDLATGENTLLTDGGRSQNGGWQWSPSKTKICYGSTRRNGADRDLWIMDPLRPDSNTLVMENTGGGWSVADWSKDESQLLVVESLSINKTNLYLFDLSTKKRTPLVDLQAEVAYGEAKFAGDGKGIYITTDALGEFQQLAYMDLATKKLEILTGDIPWDIEGIELNHAKSRLAFTVNAAGATQLYVMDLSTRKSRQVGSLPVGVIGLGKWMPDDSGFSINITSAQSASDVFSVDAKELSLTRWTESEMGGLVPSELKTAQLIEWKSFDGRTISGFLYLPPAKFEGKRPVIINIHGGPEGQSRPIFLARNNYFLNELGCAILFPNVRGSVGYGKSFSKLDNGFQRLDSVKDIGALLDEIARMPSLDASRVMVTGGSYGGYMTLACAVEYNDRISCSLDVVGISHFGTFLKNTESYRRDLRRVEYGDERDPKMAAFFEKIAPLNNSGKITKPLFVVQGGNDPRVPLSEAEQMVAQVQSNKSPVWYLMANDEGHGFRKKPNADFQFYATILYVQQYLLK